VILGSVVLSGACTLESQKAPALTGPSELGLSLIVTATPDLVATNGASQSVITVVARDTNGQPSANVQLRVDAIDTTTGAIVETMGTLSARTITTGSNGQASVMFTAPMETGFGVDAGSVAVRVVPISTNFGSQIGRFVTIRLVPPATIVVPGAPTPDFFFTPANPRPGQVVTFDASRSFDSDGFIASYKWEWGDGESATKTTATEDHDYVGVGTYFVTLTITDNSGQQSFITKKIIVQ
jgi:hypothetical protein